jgi:cell division initiation protein
MTMDLTPLDVRKKKGDFRRRLRGYDPQRVDDFLDLVAERLEELVRQNVSLSEEVRQLQEQVAAFRERERALNQALVAAQELREQARQQAEREAVLVRREAEAAAQRIVEEGQRALREVKRQLELLEGRKASFLRAFRSLLERYAAELEVEEARLSDEAGTGAPAPGSRAAGAALRPAPAAPAAPAPRPAPPKPAAARGSLDPTVRVPRGGAARPAPRPEPGREPEGPGGPAGAEPAAAEDWLTTIFGEPEARDG